MKFMLILKSSKDSEAGKMPSEESIAAMVKYNQEQAQAGILLDAAGLYPSSKGARVRFSAGGKKAVIDGPFAESKELVAGYWLIQVKSLEEAIEWAKQSPFRRTVRTRRPKSKYENLLSSNDFPPRHGAVGRPTRKLQK